MGQKSILDVINNGLVVLENDGNNVETSVYVKLVLKNIGVGGID